MSTAIRMQKAHKLTLATATESDISGIRNLIATQRIYDLIARSGATSSDKGFLFANLSEREWFKLINDEYVWVVKNGNQVSGVLLATKASSNKYEKLPKPKTTWTSPRIRTIYESDDFLYLWIISVHSDVQGMGVGKRLLSGLVEKARLEGVSVIIADFMSFPVLNRQSQRFFQSSGFYAGGELSIADYYGAGNSLWDIYYYDLARD